MIVESAMIRVAATASAERIGTCNHPREGERSHCPDVMELVSCIYAALLNLPSPETGSCVSSFSLAIISREQMRLV